MAHHRGSGMLEGEENIFYKDTQFAVGQIVRQYQFVMSYEGGPNGVKLVNGQFTTSLAEAKAERDRFMERKARTDRRTQREMERTAMIFDKLGINGAGSRSISPASPKAR
mmetsp:Transcript_61196/g.176268  ORF Transcript_61196/g.176268 Transcript_61196/m.176268 type:complete len:110 (+) Transcript_61196:59-388(+)